MGYKKYKRERSFSDIEVERVLEGTLKLMEKINKVVNWKDIEAVLMEYYEVGKSKEGADAYPPIM